MEHGTGRIGQTDWGLDERELGKGGWGGQSYSGITGEQVDFTVILTGKTILVPLGGGGGLRRLFIGGYSYPE